MPILLAIPALVTSVLGGISALSVIVGTYIIAKVTSKVFIMTSQIVVSVALIGAHIVLLGFFLYAIMFVFNKYNDLIELIATLNTQSEILSLAWSILQSIGLFDAFTDVFAIFSPFIIAYLSYRVALIVYVSFEKTSNELFKIGVLLQE